MSARKYKAARQILANRSAVLAARIDPASQARWLGVSLRWLRRALRGAAA